MKCPHICMFSFFPMYFVKVHQSKTRKTKTKATLPYTRAHNVQTKRKQEVTIAWSHHSATTRMLMLQYLVNVTISCPPSRKRSSLKRKSIYRKAEKEILIYQHFSYA